MSQNDFNLANQGFPSFRSDLNSALQALASNSAGTTAPSTTYANQWWFDTTANILKFRNEANDAWIEFAYFSGSGFYFPGDLGIGAAPGHRLDVKGSGGGSDVAARIQNLDTTVSDHADLRLEIAGTTADCRILFGDAGDNDAGAIRYDHTNNRMTFRTAGVDEVYITSAGEVGIGTAAPTELLHVTGNGRFDGNILGRGDVRANADGFTPSASNNNTSFVGARIRGDGGSHVFSVTGDQVLLVNRMTNDGALVTFYGQGNAEGAISVSGSTITYGGGHLARWSRLPTEERADIPKGTVLTNLDAMVVWQKPDGTIENNEQLNQTEISSVEGDPNVAGVFDHWDNDDDEGYNSDFYVALTGDFIIRIAQGTTVQRGDLLMSAGDGTAKPQGDDIVRSKTIAKVTSTHVTCTYEDGSYCVPCVLMAC
jgi:hypothetical protein